MSVINRMLKELEERREDVMQTRIPGLVRAVPARGARALKRLPWPTLGGAALLLLLGLLSWRLSSQWQFGSTVSARPAAIEAAPSSETPQPAASSTPTLRTEAVLSAAPLISPTVSPSLDTQTASVPPVKPVPRPSMVVANQESTAPAIENERAREASQSAAPALSTSEKARVEQVKPESMAPAVTQRQTLAASDKVEILKSAPGGETPLSSMKQISKEQRADFRYREALALINQGRIQEAQTALDDILRLDPRNIPARQVLLGLLLEAKRYPEAEQLLQDALQNNVAPANNAMALARVQIERGEQASALNTLEKYLAQAGDTAAYHGFYAALLQRAGRHAEAITQFQKALKVQPGLANWWLGLGVSLQNEKRNSEAEQAYLRARAGNTLSAELQAFIDQRLKQIQAAKQ